MVPQQLIMVAELINKDSTALLSYVPSQSHPVPMHVNVHLPPKNGEPIHPLFPSFTLIFINKLRPSERVIESPVVCALLPIKRTKEDEEKLNKWNQLHDEMFLLVVFYFIFLLIRF